MTFARIVRNLFITPTSVYVVADVWDRHHQPAKLMPVPTTHENPSSKSPAGSTSGGPAESRVASPLAQTRKSMTGDESAFV